jgi:ACS family hexuronate transporter-like MFS transporter
MERKMSERHQTKIAKLRWYILGLVIVTGIINYIDRNTLSVLAPTLEKTLHFSTEQYSFIVTAFLVCYGLMQPVAGYLVDLLGLRYGYFLFILAWGVASVLPAFAGTWQVMAIYVGLLGLTASAMIPAAVKTSAVWFPPTERSVAIGWANTGTSIGAMLTPPIVIWIELAWGWQYAFVATGAAAITAGVLWLIFYRNPEKHPLLDDQERVYITGTKAETLPSPSLRKVLVNHAFWAQAISRFLTEPAWQIFSFWIPLYMIKTRGMDIKEFALFGWLPFLAADFGSLFGGYLSPYLHTKWRFSLVNSRIAGIGVAACCMIGPGLVGLISSPIVAIMLFSLGGFAHQMESGLLYSLVTDKFEKQNVATATGLAGMAGYMGASLFTITVGQLVAVTGYEPVFICLSIFDLTAFFAVWYMLGDHRRSLTGTPNPLIPIVAGTPKA